MSDYSIYQRKMSRKLRAWCYRIRILNRLHSVCMLYRLTHVYFGETDFGKPAAIVQHVLSLLKNRVRVNLFYLRALMPFLC